MPRKRTRQKKATNRVLDRAYLQARYEAAATKGFTKAKWIQFCEEVMSSGLTISLYEARRTFSKYLTVTNGQDSFKVRFSNHKPIKARDAAGDCDFFVGRTHLGVTKTEDAVDAVFEFFKIERADAEVIE